MTNQPAAHPTQPTRGGLHSRAVLCRLPLVQGRAETPVRTTCRERLPQAATLQTSWGCNRIPERLAGIWRVPGWGKLHKSMLGRIKPGLSKMVTTYTQPWSSRGWVKDAFVGIFQAEDPKLPGLEQNRAEERRASVISHAAARSALPRREGRRPQPGKKESCSQAGAGRQSRGPGSTW